MPKSSLYGKPRQLRHASELIARGLSDIATGRSSGKFPALDSIIGRRPSDTVCTPDCEHRKNPDLIHDVRPPITERVAVLEHITADIKEKFEDHRAESIRAGALFATKEEVYTMDRRIDRDILPAIRDVQRSNTVKLVLVTIGAIVSIVYGVIMTYKYLHL